VVLLQLAGGTDQKLQLRGDIKMCIVGYPSVSKSQFLKWAHKFLPTLEKTCVSEASMTAEVTKDDGDGQRIIEAGSIMLADNSVYSIDEFNHYDVTAIDEVMRQQTTSIAKASVQDTLNVTATILVACS
jgi:DNA replication licensing factor MCM6